MTSRVRRASNSPAMPRLVWAVQIVVAVILGQTLFFKFSGAPESIYIFHTLGVEPFGRYLAGSVELVSVVLLLVPGFAWLGAGLALATISGAILSHLAVLGIEVQGDGGLLFLLALVVFAGSVFVLFARRREIPVLGARLPF